MKLAFRPVLTELELQDKETLASPLGLLERAAFRNYRTFAQQVRESGRNANKEEYDRACTRLENAWEQIDLIVQSARRI